MANVSEFDYEKVGFDAFMERDGGLYGDPEMAIGSVDLGEKTTKEIEGWDLENLRIESWIKSRNYKPGSSGFMLDGKTGKITCKLLEVTSGEIRYNKTSFSDSANEGYWIGNEGVYFGAAADATKFKFTIATGVIEFVGVTIDGTSTIDGKLGTGFSTVVDDGATPAIPTGLSVTAGIQYNLLEWTANSETDMSHYEVWRNTTDNSGAASKIGDNKTTLMVDGGLTGGQAYYYWLKAVDHLGNTSGFNAVGGVTATPRNVTNSDVTQGIAAEKILIDGVVYLSNWRHGSDVTKIDGGDIYSASVTTSQLNFTPLISSGATGAVIATINASTEGITIEADNLTIAATTTFTSGWAAASNAETDIDVLNTTNAPAAANADVTQTKIDGGIITTGYITLSTAGNIKSGKASYADTTAGWWLGKDSTTPKFNIGTATKYFKWDGTNITWKGANTELDASGNLIASSVTVSGALTTGAGSTINGGYVDSLNANKITAGTMDATRIDGGDINGVTITGVTITGGIIKTASANKRVELNSTGNLNEIAFYNANDTLSGKFYGAGTEIQGGPWLFLTAKTYIDGEVWIDGTLKLHGSGDKYLYLRDPVSTPAYIKASSSSPYNVSINRSWIPNGTCNLGASTAGWSYLYFGNSGKYLRHDGSTFRLNSSLVPTSSTLALGSNSYKWNTLYMNGGASIYWNGTSYYLRHDGTQFIINDDLQPAVDNTSRLGYKGGATNKSWYAVHSYNYLACPLPTSNSGIEIFKKIKKPKIKEGKKYHSGKRHYFEINEFPDEMKMTDKDSGEKDIELTRTLGVTVSAVKELVETIDDLKNRLKILETKTN